MTVCVAKWRCGVCNECLSDRKGLMKDTSICIMGKSTVLIEKDKQKSGKIRSETQKQMHL